MRRRHWMLIPSFALAAAVYYGIYTIAPDIVLLAANAALPDVESRFQVEYRDIPQARPEVQAPIETVEDLSAAPESIRELLNETLGPPPMDLAPPEPVEIPDAADRLAQETLTRTHDFDFPEGTLQSIETELLQISERAARDEIEIARRFVDPVDTRLLEGGEVSSLLGGGGGGAATMLPPPPPIAITAEEPPAEESVPADEAMPVLEALDHEAPPVEQVARAPMPPPAPSLDAMEIESVLIEETIRQEVRGADSFQSMDRLVRLETATYVDSAGLGYFRLRFVPLDSPELPRLPKVVTFVVDASRSIVQRKLDQTALGLRDCLDLLNPGDRFNVVVFRDHPRFFREQPAEVTPENIQAAAAFITGLESIGSTDLQSAITPLLQQPPDFGVPAVIMVVSDGRPTGTYLAGRELINALTTENRHRIPIYTAGAGQTVNRYLLDLLAYRNKGATRIVPEIDGIRSALPDFFKRFSDAILVDLRADLGSVPRDEVYPREIPDFYRGQVVTLFGRFTPGTHDRLVVRLQGETGSSRKEIILTTILSEAEPGTDRIAHDWALQKSYYLIGEMTRVGATAELVSELGRLGREYGVETAYSP